MRAFWDDLTSSAKAALLLALTSTFVRFEATSSTRINGVVTSCSYFDFGAVGFGGLAVIASVFAIKDGRTANNPTPSYIVSGLSMLIALYSIASGLGIIGSPCP